jgi:hypothetical protein
MSLKGRAAMGKGRHHRMNRHQRFEDHALTPQDEASSFYFDLKLMLPPGMTAHDVQMARQSIEHRLHQLLRKKDRIVWTAGGFFVSIGTEHPARAAAAAERIHQDLCAMLRGDTVESGSNRENADPSPYGHPPPRHAHLNH